MNVAIIPARGGSKRIPKKNIKDFLGKPIIAYSIENAINSKLFDRVIVSTDDKEIAEISITYGAEAPFIRPPELSDDFAGTHEVVGHAIQWLEKSGEVIDYACCIYATAPFIKEDDLIDGYKLIKTGDWDSVIAVTNFSYPIFRSFKELPSGGVEMFFPDFYFSRSQDLPEAYHDAGQFYWARAEKWINKPDGFSERTGMVKLPAYRVKDIDTLDDWIEAEFIYRFINESL